MTRTLTRDEIRNLQTQIKDARSIDDVLKIARTRRIERIPGGYRISGHASGASAARDVEYTEADLAWFRAPIKGGAL